MKQLEFRIDGIKFCLLKHNCDIQNMVQLTNGQKPTKCPFYMRMWKARCFNFLGLRLIIGDFK